MSTAARSVPRSRAVRVPLAVLRAARPAEWIKNGFVLAPLIFSGRFDHAGTAVRAIVVMAGFCAIASAGYLLNDLLDVELDRQHPTKRHRPIASGDLSEPLARTLAIALAVIGLGAGFAINWKAGALVGGYGILTVSYSLFLKHLVIIDVMTIVTLFVVRVLAGAVPLGITVSHWLLVCAGMLSLFLGFTKRRQEAASELHSGMTSRPVLEHYSLPFLDQMVSAVTAGTIISYILYAQSSPIVHGKMLGSVPPVLYGVFRYLYLIYDRGDNRSTATLVTKDPGIIGAVVAWIVIVACLLYFF
ncbi:MAG: UbiA prenyltransferase [Solirubrobacterales bacterium]|nr:UbiA prenyltransferase [Solirubrobacterales bacterium]